MICTWLNMFFKGKVGNMGFDIVAETIQVSMRIRRNAKILKLKIQIQSGKEFERKKCVRKVFVGTTVLHFCEYTVGG